ncbi:MAG: tetratricopeptide repeat protein [Burkholderiales bacterium]|nr:tetratricopeptide repeat protein [Burkholderiales bacterium]
MSSSALWVRILALATTCAVVATPLAWAGPLEDRAEAISLYRAGKIDAASTKINAFLAAQPKDPQGRFVKGLILTEQKKVNEAIQVFTALTEDFPELPEPYNNLAVLYASLGNYDKAKAALELAIHTHPSYATAHENLGDIYAQLARRAYDKALQLDKNNTAAQTKLSMVKDLFSAGGGKAAAPTQVAAATQTPVAPATKASTPKAADVTPPKAATPAKTAEAKPEPKTTPASAVAKAESAKTEPAKASGDAEGQVTAAINAWAKAWSDKNVAGYLAAYAPDFDTPDGLKRAAWEQQRKERIERPKSISVEVKVNKITVSGNEATAYIRQSYKSDTLKSNTNKTLKLVKSGDKWLIRQERAG